MDELEDRKTERERAEEALKESETNYRALIDDLPELICRSAPDLTRLYVNEGYCRYFGKSREELIGRSFLELLPEGDHEPLKEHLASLSREEPVGTFEHRVWRHDGEVRWQQWTNRAVYDEDGDFTGYQAVGRDFNVCKQAEEALKESEERFRSLTDASFEGIAICDEDGKVLEANKAFTDMFGYGLSEARGMDILEFYVPEDREKVRQRIPSGPDKAYEAIGYRKDGTTFDLEVRGRVAARADSTIRISALRDVTDRKRAQEVLRESEERYRAVVEDQTELICRSSSDLRLTFVNEAYCRYFGKRREELVGKSYLPLILEEDRGKLVERLSHLSPENPTEEVEHRVLTPGEPGEPGGEVRWQHWINRAIFDEGGNHLLGYQSVGRDVTGRKEAEEALKESEERFRQLAENVREVFWIISAAERRLLYVSPAFEEVWGRSPQELFVNPEAFLDYVHPEDRAWVSRARATMHRGEFEEEYRIVRPDGEVRWVRDRGFPVQGAGGEADRMVGVAEDVTERKEAEEALRESEERFRALVQNASDMMAILNPDGTIRYVSPAVERVLGYRVEQRVGVDAFGEDTHPRDVERMRGVFNEGLRSTGGVSPSLEFRVRHKDGSWRTLEARAANHLDHPSVRGIVVNARDVTERKAYEKLLEHQALHDPLTGLPNRTLFMDRLRHTLARKGRRQEGGEVAVLFMDLDNFKVVNDSLGHEAGDRLLVAAAGRLRDLLRPADTIARFGGDEFAVLLEVAASGEAVRVAERIEEALRGPFELRGHEAFVTASVGIALDAATEGGSDELLRAADLAMYRAKESGKAHHEVFEPRMGSEALERLKLEGELRRAIEREELVLRYQPKVSLESGQIIGLEALVRWEHPEHGLLLPGEFVPLAEETGLIVPLGRWVLKEACRQACEWWERVRSGGAKPVVVMCVNVSARQFGHPALARDVAEALREADLGPGALELEITESAIVDTPHTASTLDELKRLGVKLVVDDFGTGYSSLSYLKRLPVDLVKVDRSFVAGLGESREEEQIVAAVISMSHTLGLRVVAEGVETEGQLGLLRELRCDLAQGRLFSGPLPPEAVPELLAGGSRWS